MSFKDFMNKIRYWDTLAARWMMRHFYILFFEFVLIVIFFIFFFNTLRTIDIANHVSSESIIEKLLLQQSIHTLLIIVLLLLNSFWMLYIFSEIGRLKSVLKEISFNLLRRKP